MLIWLYARSPMQFKAFEPGIDVHGSSVDAFVEAFKLFPSVILKRLVSNGIGTTNAKGDITIDRDGWYPQISWLSAFESIASTIGHRALFQIGQGVPKHAIFPPRSRTSAAASRRSTSPTT